MIELPVYDLHIIEGEDFEKSFRLKIKDDSGVEEYVDLTGYIAESQLRKDFAQESPVILEFATFVVPESITISLTSPETVGIVDVQKKPTNPKSLAGYYDIFLTDPVEGKRKYLIGGKVNYIQVITRS